MIDFRTEPKLRTLLEGIPGIGDNIKSFRVKAVIDDEHAKHLMDIHGIDAAENMREALNGDTALHLIKEMHSVLRSLPSKDVSLDELVQIIASENVVITNVKVSSMLQDSQMFIPQNSGASTISNAIFQIGKIGTCSVYVNAIIPYAENSVFVIKENVLSLKTVSEGKIFDGTADSILLEGSYTTSSCTNNRHYRVV